MEPWGEGLMYGGVAGHGLHRQLYLKAQEGKEPVAPRSASTLLACVYHTITHWHAKGNGKTDYPLNGVVVFS